MSMNFFIGLRRIFAYQRALESMGAIAVQVINDHFIPTLKEAIDDAENRGDEREADRLGKLLELYQIYGNPSRPESRIFGKSAAQVIRNRALAWRMSEESIDELAQQISVDLFAKGVGIRSLNRFPITGLRATPIEYNKYWMSVVDGQTKWYIRDFTRRNPDIFKKIDTIEDLDDGVGGRRDVFDTIEDKRTTITQSDLEDIEKGMIDYVKKHAKNDLSRALFDLWMEKTDSRGPDAVRMKRDVYPQLMDKFGVSESLLNMRHKELKHLIVDYFRNELDYKISDMAKKRLHVSSVDVVASEMFHRRFAAWILCIN